MSQIERTSKRLRYQWRRNVMVSKVPTPKFLVGTAGSRELLSNTDPKVTRWQKGKTLLRSRTFELCAAHTDTATALFAVWNDWENLRHLMRIEQTIAFVNTAFHQWTSHMCLLGLDFFTPWIWSEVLHFGLLVKYSTLLCYEGSCDRFASL